MYVLEMLLESSPSFERGRLSGKLRTVTYRREDGAGNGESRSGCRGQLARMIFINVLSEILSSVEWPCRV